MGNVPAFEALMLVLHLATTTPSLSPQHAASVSYLCSPLIPRCLIFLESSHHSTRSTVHHPKSFYFASPPCRSMPLRLATWPDRDRPRIPRRPSGLSTRAITAQRRVLLRRPHV